MNMLRILIALDSFKGSIGSLDACNALARGLSRHDIHCEILPISDGGEGMLEAIIHSTPSYNKQTLNIQSPYNDTINATYLYNSHEAIIEMAQSSGLALSPPEQRKTINATSYGLGEVIADAYQKGAKKMILGLGGSATNDGGIGCLQALGVCFFDQKGNAIPQRASGIHLKDIAYFQMGDMANHLRNECEIIIACDVRNPLLGENGATYVYGKQKGATQQELDMLEHGMQHFSTVVHHYFGQSFASLEGSGAAGGMGFGLVSFLNARIQSGITTLLDLTQAKTKIAKSDLVITGEGRLDLQSRFGKAPMGVAALAHELNKPTIAICGSLGDGYEKLHDVHIQAMFSIIPHPMPLEDAMKDAHNLLYQFGRELAGVLRLNV